MAEANLADPKLYNGWITSNANDSAPKTRTMLQSGSGPGNHQSFAPFDNAFYRMLQPPNQMYPNDVMYARPLADHNGLFTRNIGEVSTSEHHVAAALIIKTLSNNDVVTDDAFSHEQYLKFKNIVVKGCESAEHLAYFHRNRPCFKKINCLCARLKQDVDRADSVLANINSQGVPWAVKDFIFVFTRIVSAWNIIKDYVYNNSDGMRTIKSAISDKLVVSFLKWQEVTSDFVEDLIKSFDGLQELTLSQTRSCEYQKTSEANPGANEQKRFASDTESFESLQVNKDCTNERPASNHSSDSSLGQLNATVKQLLMGSDGYIKTGIYKCTVAKQENHLNDNGFHSVTELKSQNTIRVDDAKKFYVPNVLPARLTADKFYRNVIPEVLTKNSADIAQGMMGLNLTKNRKSDLLQKVCFIEESKFFFTSQFTKNYFPDYLKVVPDFVDLRSIIVKSEMNILNSIYEVVHQIRQIFFGAKVYLQERHHELLKSCVTIFESEFEKLLMTDFAEFDFKLMTVQM